MDAGGGTKKGWSHRSPWADCQGSKCSWKTQEDETRSVSWYGNVEAVDYICFRGMGELGSQLAVAFDIKGPWLVGSRWWLFFEDIQELKPWRLGASREDCLFNVTALRLFISVRQGTKKGSSEDVRIREQFCGPQPSLHVINRTIRVEGSGERCYLRRTETLIRLTW